MVSEQVERIEKGRGKFQWVKLSVDCFNDEKIKLIEGMPDGDMILVVWFKLLAQAGRCNARGFIVLSDTIPFTPEMLARFFGKTLEQIKYALGVFERLGMIRVDGETIMIANFMKHHPEIEDREKERERKRRYRLGERGGKTTPKLIDGAKQCAVPGTDAGMAAVGGDEAHVILVASPNLRGVTWERDLHIRQSRSDISDWVPVYRKLVERAEDYVNGLDEPVLWLRKQVEGWGYEKGRQHAPTPSTVESAPKAWEPDAREVLPPGFVPASKRV